MNTQLQNALALAARVLMAILFLPAGLSKVSGFGGTVAYIASVGLPLAQAGAVLAIVVEAGGSLALLAGFQTRWAAAVMAVFCFATAAFFHQFWAAPAEQAMAQSINFFKDVAIAGGLLQLVAFGAGGWSVDARKKSPGLQ